MIIRKKYLFMGLFLLCLTGLYLKGSAEESEGKVEVKWLYPPKYFAGTYFSEGRAWVQEERDGPWSLLDDRGNVLKAGFEASYVFDYEDGIAFFGHLPADENARSLGAGLLNRSGDVVLSPDVYDGVCRIYGEGVIVREGRNGLYGFIDLNGKWVIPPAYDFCAPFREGFAVVVKNGKCGFIDKKGDVVIDFKFDEAYWFSHKMAPVRVGSKWGVIAPNGSWIAEPIYEKICEIYWSDPIGLEKDGKVGFINSEGDVVIDFQYPPVPEGRGSRLYSFENGRASVILDDSDEGNIEYGIIDESGKVLFRKKNCRFSLREGYVVCINEDEQLSVIDQEWREYRLPSNFDFPLATTAPHEKDIYKFAGIGKHRTGYLVISVNRD